MQKQKNINNSIKKLIGSLVIGANNQRMVYLLKQFVIFFCIFSVTYAIFPAFEKIHY